jgi:dTDP-glucose 4,6-dehydratase
MYFKKAIVIGSNSFSGSSFISLLLKKRFKIIGISRSNFSNNIFLKFNPNTKMFRFLKLDINKDKNRILKLVKKFKPKYLINYSAQSMVGESWESPEDWLMTNSYSIPVLYNQIFKIFPKIRFVHISTPEIYGNSKKKIYESKVYNPSTPYAVSRVTADQYLSIMNKEKSLDYVSLRAANVYGETQKLYRIIPKTVAYCFLNKKIPLHGNGISKRSFIHIDDVSEATFLVMTKGASGQIYNVSTERNISIRRLVNIICNKLNKNFNQSIKISKDRIGKDSYYNLSSSKLKKLGWKPKISLAEGIDRVINWFNLHKKYFKKSDYIYLHKK